MDELQTFMQIHAQLYQMRRIINVSSLAACVARRPLFTKTCVHRIEQDPVELAREEDLRRKVQAKYRGMQIPPLVNPQYGHFSTAGINEAAARQAAGDAGSFGFGGFAGSPFRNRGGTDWLMLFTGCVLVYFSGKILFHQFTRGVKGLEMPLWVASVELQAKHILFAVQFDQVEQEQLEKGFEAFRQSNPFADFFQWVRSQKPEFCSGRRYDANYVMQTLVSALRSNDSAQLATLARTVQQAMRQRSGDSLQRLDSFVGQLQTTEFAIREIRETGSLRPAFSQFQPAPAFAPPAVQNQGGADESDLNSALDAKNGETHSSMPFAESK